MYSETVIASVRSTFGIPANLSEVIQEEGFIAFISRTTLSIYAVNMPLAKRAKPKRRCYFACDRSSAAQFPSLVERQRAGRAEEVAREKARLEAAASFDANSIYKNGDFVVNTWGWEQTNVDFYVVVGVTAKAIDLRRVKSVKTYDGPGSMTGRAVPMLDALGRPVLETGASECEANGKYRPRPGAGSPGLVKFEYGFGDKWNGKPKSFSEYA